VVEALHYKPEGRGSIPDEVSGFFSLNGVDAAPNRNEYQDYFRGGGGKGGRCVGLTTLPPSCADCIEIWEPQPPGLLYLICTHVCICMYVCTLYC
jgi:hypothetical protein